MNAVRAIMATDTVLSTAGHFMRSPLVLCLDEAHLMLPKTVSLLSNEYPLEAFSVIAKEGRKYDSPFSSPLFVFAPDQPTAILGG